jgi:hypothetical protein
MTYIDWMIIRNTRTGSLALTRTTSRLFSTFSLLPFTTLLV